MSYGLGVSQIRFVLLYSALFVVSAGLIFRIIDVCVLQRDFLVHQSNMRTVRTENMLANRGSIYDRQGKLLAMSVPMSALWVDPVQFKVSKEKVGNMAAILQIDPGKLRHDLQRKQRFRYLQHGLSTEQVQDLHGLGLKGLNFTTEYKRFYPEGTMYANIIGRVNNAGQGQEGLEMQFEDKAHGIAGKNIIERDLKGEVLSRHSDSQAQNGEEINLSLDTRLQYTAYKQLEDTVINYHAESGVAVIVNVKTGEILAAASYPSYDPNLPIMQGTVDNGGMRNRLVTDVQEPGSTMKIFSAANAIINGRYTPDSIVPVGSGKLKIGRKTIEDVHANMGDITLTEIIKKSSNVGIAKVTLDDNYATLVPTLRKFGFGQTTKGGFPGEASGYLPGVETLHKLDYAVMSFGYSMNATMLQLARAYAAIANDGVLMPLSWVKLNHKSDVKGKRILSSQQAKDLQEMLHAVTKRGGTGFRARVKGYEVGGKTGTTMLAGKGGYVNRQYVATFAGLAPVNDPRFVTVVSINKPDRAHRFGSLASAPTFAVLMKEVLQLYPVNDKAEVLGGDIVEDFKAV